MWPYKNQTYPEYVSGAGFLVSRNVAVDLFKASLRNWMIPIDDAFIGILLNDLKKRPEHNEYFQSRGSDQERNCEWLKKTIILHKTSTTGQLKLWNKFKFCERSR